LASFILFIDPTRLPLGSWSDPCFRINSIISSIEHDRVRYQFHSFNERSTPKHQTKLSLQRRVLVTSL